MKNGPDKLAQVMALVASHSWAAGFQSLGQYRAALLKEIATVAKDESRLVDGPPSCDSGCCIARQVTPSAGGEL
ncbi:hypothetical protein D3C81_1374290 [compost metagenome]